MSKELRILRTTPSETTFEENIPNVKKGLIDRGSRQTLIENLLSEIKFTERESALLKHNNKEEEEILLFMTQYRPSVCTFKEAVMKKLNLIQDQPLIRQIFKEPPFTSYKKGKSLEDMLVRANIQRINTGFHAGMDVQLVCGLSPLAFSQITSSLFLKSPT